jgi:hypothetical protein
VEDGTRCSNWVLAKLTGRDCRIHVDGRSSGYPLVDRRSYSYVSYKVGVGICYSCEPVYPYPMTSVELPAASTPAHAKPFSFAICRFFLDFFRNL